MPIVLHNWRFVEMGKNPIKHSSIFLVLRAQKFYAHDIAYAAKVGAEQNMHMIRKFLSLVGGRSPAIILGLKAIELR